MCVHLIVLAKVGKSRLEIAHSASSQLKTAAFRLVFEVDCI